jgi:hypothetical protein
MMHGHGKSDPEIVAMKPANNTAPAAAELVERRAGAKGNAGQQSTLRAQDRVGVSQAARHNKKERFTALLHHVNPETLRLAFNALKKDAAPGVDGRYVAKIVPYKLPDGGFAFIPAYPGFNGHIVKVKMADTFFHLVQPRPPVILDGRSVSHRIKASFHDDGSTQISGAGSTTSVTSGREVGGTFKGMGALGRPFSTPVFTGSVIGMTAWGLPFYPRANVSKDVIRFSSAELGKKGLLDVRQCCFRDS